MVQPRASASGTHRTCRNLGAISRGVRLEHERIQIVRFDHGPFANTDRYCTLGLSHHVLGQGIRLELLMMIRRGDQSRRVFGVLADVVDEIIARHEAPSRGVVIGPRGPLWDETRLEALYVASPVYLPDSFAHVELENGERCFVAWLIPITLGEADFVHSHGSSAFEELLVAENPDLLAVDRDSCNVR